MTLLPCRTLQNGIQTQKCVPCTLNQIDVFSSVLQTYLNQKRKTSNQQAKYNRCLKCKKTSACTLSNIPPKSPKEWLDASLTHIGNKCLDTVHDYPMVSIGFICLPDSGFYQIPIAQNPVQITSIPEDIPTFHIYRSQFSNCQHLIYLISNSKLNIIQLCRKNEYNFQTLVDRNLFRFQM